MFVDIKQYRIPLNSCMLQLNLPLNQNCDLMMFTKFANSREIRDQKFNEILLTQFEK